MKKIVIIGFVLMLTIASFLYAFLQRTQATKARMEAVLNEKAAIEARAIADRNAEIAKQEAQRANQLADSLKKCKGR